MPRKNNKLVYGLVSGVFAGVSGLMIAAMLTADPQATDNADKPSTAPTEQIDPLTPLSTTEKARKVLIPSMKSPAP